MVLSIENKSVDQSKLSRNRLKYLLFLALYESTSQFSREKREKDRNAGLKICMNSQ